MEKKFFLNHQINEEDKMKRINMLYQPYHEKLHQLTGDLKPQILLSIHSFTPVYESTPRNIEIGVLYNQDKTLAQQVLDQLSQHSYVCRLNEPWSGKEGFMFSVENAGKLSSNTRTLMLEFRQDLLTNVQWRTTLVARLHQALSSCLDKQNG